MHLKKIKLAGFKSFVDPTTVTFPSKLTSVVGPNGCGKSNIIDAVRWVMGESSAKNLRGDSITDVIFNGSSGRKPVGQASIELIFDNSDGKLQGQYANYNEISIRRVVNREAQSSYYLNNTRCRRKDITDIFLGTGLGPRSYSIIEQGTISRLIEAKPEELRIFLEEAAGISKYKERRRETETRIRHTRENLDRVNDLVEEVSKRLRHLERQAKTAEKYQNYKKEERMLSAQLNALRWVELDEQVNEEQKNVQLLETSVQESNARKFHYEAELENFREEHITTSDAFNQTQGEYYSVGADIARIEQSIAHNRERRAQVETDMETLVEQKRQCEHELNGDLENAELLAEETRDLDNQWQHAQSEQEFAAAELQECEEHMQQWQLEWEQFNENATQPSQTAQIEKARIEQLEGNLLQYNQREQRLRDELRSIHVTQMEQEIEHLREGNHEVELQVEHKIGERDACEHQIADCRDRIKQGQNALTEMRSRSESLTGRLASLEALQQDALNMDLDTVNAWLQQHALISQPRMAQILDVEPGWELAVECVLKDYLQAVCVDDLPALLQQLASTPGSMVFYHGREGANDFAPEDTLLSKVKSKLDLKPVLGHVYIAEDISSAVAKLDQLSSGSVVTRQGIWLGRGWARVLDPAQEDKGVLVRERQIKELHGELQPLSQAIQAHELQLEQAQEALVDHERQARILLEEIESLRTQGRQLQSQLSSRQTRLENARERVVQIETELGEFRDQTLKLDEELKQAYGRLNEALVIMEEHAQLRDQLSRRRDEISAQLSQAREQYKEKSAEAHNLELRLESNKANMESNDTAINRLRAQIEQMQRRLEDLEVIAQQVQTPEHELNAQLEQLLSQRVDVEKSLADKREHVELLERSLREMSKKIHDGEQEIFEVREQLDQVKLHWQELKIRRETVMDLLQESDFSIEQLVETMPEDADINTWHENLEHLQKRIERLGAINLAAIDEFAQEMERKQYLDAQVADLNEALDTLDRAIKKIDKDTRSKFKDTFERVNKGFNELFPRLFGGGSAYLELTGEDLLDCGVTVMARPPGKRNSTIHLLSGGEKALTAVALVFSIFNLNPAPFCMLDEVDAPLDDANVGRFCNMVKEMSDRVQFIVITHNKITMEMAHQLSGVTMHEPGVSRLVAVDIEEAVEMVAV